MYENLSIVYDKLMDVDYDAYKNIIDQELEERENLLVLDLGCGSGEMLSTLKTYGEVLADDEISYLWFTYETENSLEVESELSFFLKENNGLYRKLEQFHSQRTYEIEEVFTEIQNIGFKVKDYFCDFEKNNKNYDESDRIIFILEK